MMNLNPPITQWQNRRVWLIGASSGIGLALAEKLAAQKANVIVSARNREALDAFVAKHPGSQALPLDVSHPESLAQAFDTLYNTTGCPDLVCYCAGHYKPLRAPEYDLEEMLRHQQINVTGLLYLLDRLLPLMLENGRGHISLISSVAGFRGLPKSLAYGPTKAALINLAECLYLDVHDRGLGISLINPGFVQTPLTAQNDFAMPALITPDQAADHIIAGWERGRFHIDFPKKFTLFMRLLRILPYPLYFWLVRKITGL